MRISWESRENLVRSSWDHCTLMRILWENFSLVRISWESHENSVQASISIFRVFMRKRPNMLMRISWHSHEILMRKRSNFHVKKKTHENLMRNSWEISQEAHESWKISWENVPIFTWKRKSREILMRFGEKLMRFSWESLTIFIFSWESHEILMSTHENFCKGLMFKMLHQQHLCEVPQLKWRQRWSLSNLKSIQVFAWRSALAVKLLVAKSLKCPWNLVSIQVRNRESPSLGRGRGWLFYCQLYLAAINLHKRHHKWSVCVVSRFR